MHLKSLTLKGFKSFAQPTTFEFEPGVTAIVGPNGSGKSNVLDALAWVMGEQGAKTLRGGKMEDVIFAGTASRGPLGRAEVRLTIDNSDGALPIDYTEVTISRTLFRNGSSEYAINGEGCRLLDVQELLSDSGLGREMHVIVGQGQLDTVLRASPEDRRGFIEEAAGILKHRRRRERTLRKLESMEANLTRLEDLASEVRRQLKPLGKQAAIAKKAQQIAAEVRDAKARLLADDITRLQFELGELSKDDAQRQAEQQVYQDKLGQKQRQINELERLRQNDEVDQARRVTLNAEAVQAKLRGLFSQAQQRLTFLAGQVETTTAQDLITPEQVSAAEAEIERLADLVPAAEQQFTDATEQLNQATEQLNTVDAEIAERSAAVSAYDLALTKLRGEAEAAEQRFRATQADANQRESTLAEAAARLEEANLALKEFNELNPGGSESGSESGGEAGTAGGAGGAESGGEAGTAGGAGGAGAAAAGSGVAAGAGSLEAAYQAAGEQQTKLETERDSVQSDVHRLEREIAGLEARISALTATLQTPDASSAVLADPRFKQLQSLTDVAEIAPGYEAAVSAALGQFATAICAADTDQATAVTRFAAEQDLGRVRLLISDPAAAAGGSVTPANLTELAASAGLRPLADAVTAPAALRQLLANTFVAPDIDSAIAGHRALSESSANFTIVTAGGAVPEGAEPDGAGVTDTVLGRYTIDGGSASAPSKLEIQAEIAEAADRQARLASELEAKSEALGSLKQRVADAKTAAQAALKQLRDADAEQARIAQQRNRLTVTAEAAAAEHSRAKQNREALADAVSAAEQAAAAAATALQEAQEKPRPVLNAAERDPLVAAQEAARSAQIEARLEAQAAKERVRAAKLTAESLQRQFVAQEQAALERARRKVLRDQQSMRAQRVADALPALLEIAQSAVVEAKSRQRQTEENRAKQSQELILVRSEAAELRGKLQALTERGHSAELKSYERKLQLQSLIERAHNELGMTEQLLVTEYGPDQPVVTQPAADAAAETGDAAAAEGETPAVSYVRAEQQQRLKRAEAALAELGRINPLALEEFAALEQRNNFLHQQLGDLKNTKQDLLKIISDLDTKMENIFAAAFADTKQAFNEVFPVLFPGGSGSISLTDPQDLLNTGIEMAVKPAGKKVERLSLLSGGERSLAAIAWLIAIFKARPSPFYIMDEVEAALDDANLGRLLNAFEDLRQRSQLIVITHQKRTMEIADALYGVSMRGDGVSAVVGQRLREESA